MRFESITAHSFGPIIGATLPLAPGMTIIHGPNESGKSTWHAALYAGLCGIRRGKGQPRSEERDFASKHRPWDGEKWEVSVRIALSDGRQIELRHDLDGKVECQAVDLALGRDVSAEIINDGSPDGARWLGLDRRSFFATACVGQADILGIRESSEVLQVQLQRAAATARTDATATQAIERLRNFHAEFVGTDRAPTKPLRRAQDGLRSAEANLQQTLEEHRLFLQLASQAQEARVQAEALRQQLRVTAAAGAARDAAAWASRASRASELANRHTEGPPPRLTDDDALARLVAATLSTWERRPRVSDPQGPSSAEIRERIATIPSIPEGDLEPNPEVAAARQEYEGAERAFRLHESERPPEPVSPHTGGASEQELRDLARDLGLDKPRIDLVLESRLEKAKRRIEEVSTPSRVALVALALIGTVVGAGLIGRGGLFTGLLALLATAAVIALLVARRSGARARALEELRMAENAAGEIRHAVAEVARRKATARDRVRSLRLRVDPQVLQPLADAVAVSDQQRRDVERWKERQRHLAGHMAIAEEALTHALRDRGVQVADSVPVALASYVAACNDRARIAAIAGQRSVLESQLTATQLVEDAWQRARAAEQAIRQAATTCGIAGNDPEELSRGLSLWLDGRAAALTEHQKAREEWTELQTLLDGRALADVQVEAERRENEAEKLASELDAEPIVALSQAPDLDQQLARLRHDVTEALMHADRLEGQVEERSRTLHSVPEAEEDVGRARESLERVQRLGRAIERTLEFLERAQERVHRDIAPVLAQTVRRWLPEITGGRYADAIVDPETLAVRVRHSDGPWRQAAVLSHGTAEQVYLLLRLALTEHLVVPGEKCPLVLDDVTVQSDRVRTEAIMRCLYAISRERQVIMFTLEEEVLAWAESHLDGVRDRLVRLAPPEAGVW